MRNDVNTAQSIPTRLSIATIMAVYDGDSAVHFESAINSVVNQSLPEGVKHNVYLAVDGPVRREILAVINAKKHCIHKVTYIDKNRGLAFALNCLISSLEDEEFVFRMDSDDENYLDRFRKQLSYLGKHEEIDILGTNIVEFDEVSGETREVAYALDHDAAKRLICVRVPVAHPSVCLRRKVFSKVSQYPDVKGNEDIAFWFRCLEEGFMFGNIPEPLLRFRVTEDFWKRRSVNKSWSEFCVYFRGEYSLNGTSPRLLMPIIRLGFRILPTSFQKFAYRLRGSTFI